MTGPVRRRGYIDVMENVFGGVRIITDEEPRSRDDVRPRPWLAGVTMSSVQVSIAPEPPDDFDKPDK